MIQDQAVNIVANENLAYCLAAPTAGVVVAVGTQPLRVIATHLHADLEKKVYNGPLEVCKTLKSQGFKGMYSGLSPAILASIISIPTLNYVQSKVRKVLESS